jgi:hypothetical protein
MSTQTVDPDIIAAPLVRQLIGPERVKRLRREHPLFRGLNALEQFEEGRFVVDLTSLWQLERDAQIIRTHLVGRGFDARIGDDLADENDCSALLFECRVLGLLIEPFVTGVNWRRYEEAASDVITRGPDLQVECTQAEDYDLDGMLNKVTSKRKLAQRRVNQGAFLLVIGARSLVDLHIFRDVTQALRNKIESWSPRHTEVAAIHFCAPRVIDLGSMIEWEDSTMFTWKFCQYTGFTVRNKKAAEPLPPDFEKNWLADEDLG